MSKAFTPPETMSDDDILAVADVRRAVWTGGFKGLGAGLGLGALGHVAASNFLPASIMPLKFRAGKYLSLWTFGMGAACSFIGSSVAGKNSVHSIHDVFERGAKPELTPYQEIARQHKSVEALRSEEERALERRQLAIEEARRKKTTT